jgi:hypothetical protein
VRLATVELPKQRGLMLCGFTAAALLAFRAAQADMVLSWQDTGPNSVSGSGTVNTISSASTTYADTFLAPTTTITGTSFGFYDDFVFTVGASTFDTVATTISLSPNAQINNLQVRLYNASGNSPLPFLGSNPGGLLEGWSQQINFSPTQTISNSWINAASLGPGTYVLEVRGNVVGSGGGSYSGVLNLTPVPLPAALPLLLSGLSLGGLLRRRRRA